MIIETCPKCGYPLENTIYASYPPIPHKECHNCGWNWTGEPELIEYRPFNEKAVYSADVALEVEDA